MDVVLSDIFFVYKVFLEAITKAFALFKLSNPQEVIFSELVRGRVQIGLV